MLIPDPSDVEIDFGTHLLDDSPIAYAHQSLISVEDCWRILLKRQHFISCLFSNGVHEQKPPLKPPFKPGFLLKMVRALIYFPAIILWTVIGFYIWIPLVIRRFYSYFGAVVSSAITHNTSIVNPAAENLDQSFSFYFEGYKLITMSILTPELMSKENTQGVIKPQDEFLMSTLVWLVLGLIYLVALLLLS